jgi:hypothetical protein
VAAVALTNSGKVAEYVGSPLEYCRFIIGRARLQNGVASHLE